MQRDAVPDPQGRVNGVSACNTSDRTGDQGRQGSAGRSIEEEHTMSAKTSLLSAGRIAAAAVILTLGATAAAQAKFELPNEHNSFPTSWVQANSGKYPNAVIHRYSAPAGQVLRPGQSAATAPNF
jgi:hypothetical protein